MVKTHLPAHMDSVREKWRPKHQLLILKCYPRLPKNSAADVKPNGSELSYLLYYASTRRSKLQKLGAFLERKTTSDLYRAQSARVLVTLQILTALLEHHAVRAGSGFALIAPHILRIIREILQHTTDLSLIEATLETWEAFGKYQDEATLKADHSYRELYEDVVKRYAAFARKDGGKKLGKSMQVVAVQDAIRLREAGLHAIKSILLSDALASESGRQLDVVVPATLSNIRGSDEAYLSNLLRQSKKSEDEEKEKAVNRRMSMATVRTHTTMTDGSVDRDPRQAEGTVQDVDEYDEEQVAILALECLRAVFASGNRPQIRSATTAVLRYLADTQARPVSQRDEKTGLQGAVTNTWATKLFEICTAWTPVQDRFILMVTIVETLVRLPLNERDLGQHLLFTDLIDHILRSELNLIGLSIMDILLGLIQQILRVLQLNGPQVAGRGSRVQLFSSDEDEKHPSSPEAERHLLEAPSEARMRLTERLKHCISDLGTHVYYTDQIADMMSAILLRLKPNPSPTGQQNPLITAAAIEEPRAAVAEVASHISVPAHERSNSTISGFFSFETARQIALEAVRDVLQISNSSRALSSGGVAESKSKVPTSIWEGTQWLLRDPSPSVRTAYIDALATWLILETRKADMRIKQPKDKEKKKKEKESALARRAVSNASNKKAKQSKKATSTFLQLLHLAVFENALQFAAPVSPHDIAVADKEILSLHFLLATLVQRLGVNAVQSGLPMIFALQGELHDTGSLVAKIRLGSLVHGYFWTLSEVFDFDVSEEGQEVFAEIKTRRERGLWMEEISVPAKPIEQVASSSRNHAMTAPAAEDNIEPMKPFDRRKDLIECISDSYGAVVASPLPSAPGSPGRSPGQRRLSVSAPTLDRSGTSYLTVKPTTSTTLPDNVKEAMAETWTREGCLSAIAAAAPKSISLSGSRTSPSHALAAGNHRQLLAAANTAPMNSANQATSGQHSSAGRATPPRQQAFGQRLDSVSQSPARRLSASTNGRASSSAGVQGRVRVDDLKRVLSGGGFSTSLMGRASDVREDTASESLVDIEGEDFGSEHGGYVTPAQRLESQPEALLAVSETSPVQSKANAAYDEPPVLHLTNDTMTNGQLSSEIHGNAAGANGVGMPATRATDNAPPSRGGTSVRSRTGHSRKDLAALLAGIGPEDAKGNGQRKFSGMGRPPY